MIDSPSCEKALGEDRQAVIGRLHAALWALEHDDLAGWRSNVDALIQWRSQPLVQGLAKLARELDTALGNGAASPNASLPEACARLEHVVHVSEDASHRTLDLIQECGVLLGTLPDASTEEQAATIAAIRSRMSEMTAAQGYQDLTGQIIRRVVELVRAVHAGLGEMTDGEATPIHLNHNNRGFGPSVAGVDPTPATQDDANELLSSLGL
ncbi:protein phosphatase CheZ [Lysobacter auxotrophicus]|uniref:Protein phosphatase CheZ n=1 Tax=Lysobacter auxotrophicus TaxID=2992573 RepID=A0ABN6UNA2_9GAMM|nr:protein phosphatase CheZ [Lysobacter auxotrophicus]BDU17870.1 protein phosphatase CheZ [Lysobacter auxotrophicus]